MLHGLLRVAHRGIYGVGDVLIHLRGLDAYPSQAISDLVNNPCGIEIRLGQFLGACGRGSQEKRTSESRAHQDFLKVRNAKHQGTYFQLSTSCKLDIGTKNLWKQQTPVTVSKPLYFCQNSGVITPPLSLGAWSHRCLIPILLASRSCTCHE